MTDDFQTTHWSLVIQAGSSSTARQALETLCERYWQPIYAYVRRRVPDVHEAQDLTQSFFTAVLEKNYLTAADPERGRFRAFLLTACRNYIAKQWQKSRAQKRGGGRVVFSLDFAAADTDIKWEASRGLSAEAVFHRQWALTLLESTLQRLREETRAANALRQFEELKPFVVGDQGSERYADVAQRLGVTPSAARMAASRLRHRYRQLLREAIAETVGDPADVDDEIRNLFSVFEL